MGKEKEQKGEPAGGAYTRMNYLYQAAHLVSRTAEDNPLSHYYGKLMKEISKKMVEKLHPNLKRTMCTACNYPLTAANNQINVKIKPHRKRKRRRKNSRNVSKIVFEQSEQISEKLQQKKSTSDTNKYKKSRIEARNARPNKIQWSCYRCGFSKGFLQQPNYKLWIHKHDEINSTSNKGKNTE